MVATFASGAVETTEHVIPFLTNHALVLIVISKDEEIRMRDMARKIGITERAVQRIVDDLVSCGYLVVCKSGRRNTYRLNQEMTLRQPLMGDCPIDALLKLA